MNVSSLLRRHLSSPIEFLSPVFDQLEGSPVPTARCLQPGGFFKGFEEEDGWINVVDRMHVLSTRYWIFRGWIKNWWRNDLIGE